MYAGFEECLSELFCPPGCVGCVGCVVHAVAGMKPGMPGDRMADPSDSSCVGCVGCRGSIVADNEVWDRLPGMRGSIHVDELSLSSLSVSGMSNRISLQSTRWHRGPCLTLVEVARAPALRWKHLSQQQQPHFARSFGLC